MNATDRANRLIAEAERSAQRHSGSYAYQCGYLQQTVRSLCAQLAEHEPPAFIPDELFRFVESPYTVVCAGDGLDDVALAAVYVGAADLLEVLAADERWRLEECARRERELWAARQEDAFAQHAEVAA